MEIVVLLLLLFIVWFLIKAKDNANKIIKEEIESGINDLRRKRKVYFSMGNYRAFMKKYSIKILSNYDKSIIFEYMTNNKTYLIEIDSTYSTNSIDIIYMTVSNKL